VDKPARILVVDDDETVTDALEFVLLNNGYRVDVAANGREAIRKSENTVYNVALIDIQLPDMDGTELLTRLKDTIPKIRKIILTGHPSLQNAMESVNKDADAYLMKPINMDKLLELVCEQLKQQKTEKEYSEQKVADFIETRVKEITDTE
jgi:DNA-binding NtrC family response regulator